MTHEEVYTELAKTICRAVYPKVCCWGKSRASITWCARL